MEKLIKWGVIGSGGIARRRTIPEGIAVSGKAKLVSVFDINNKANIEVAREFNAAAADTIDDLLAEDIDAVYLASPVNLHKQQTISCATAGKHVLCEKPLGLNVDEAQKMIEACGESGVILGTGFMMRFIAQHRVALKMIKDGMLGKPVYGRAQLSCWYPPIPGAFRQNPEAGGGGSLVDMGTHCIDLLEMFLGRITRVSCFINNSVHDYRSEDSSLTILYFESGAMGSVDAFFCIPDNSSKNTLELYGSEGSIIARGTIGQGSAGEMTAFLEKNVTGYDARQARNVTGGISINPAPVNPYLAEIEEFSAAILDGKKPLNDGGAGLRNQKIVAGCYLSARTGKVIDIV